METKTCTSCQIVKPLSDFHKKVNSYRSTCKTCRSTRKPREWDSGQRTCISCGFSKSNEDYTLTASGNPRKVCKSCRHRYDMYGLSQQDIRFKLKVQKYKCLICSCNLDEKTCAVDHDHSCCPGSKTCGKCVRGLLCTQCNTRLAWFEIYQVEAMRYLGDK